ncbi:MAG: GNAT family N-acetyltransferase [Acidimicrobiia bacterium]
MDVTFRSISAEELPAFVRASSIGFGENSEWFEREKEFHSMALDRTVVGFEGDVIVATSRNYPFDITLPGGAALHAAGVSAVTVLPTHRRRGLLREMMTRLFDDATMHDEPLAMLTASEATIYGRFGFGVSHRSLGIRIDKREMVFARPRPAGRIRLIDEAEAGKVVPEVFERVRVSYPGAVSRPPEWWCHYYDPSYGTRFDAVFEAPSGSIDGYVTYSIKDTWGANGAEHVLTVRELVGCTHEAIHALWRYISEVDLIRTITARGIEADTPLPWLLTSMRAMRTEGVYDSLWTRLLDVPATLGARTYAASGRLVLGIDDPTRRGGAADGTFALDGGPDGAAVAPVDAPPDLSCGIDALSTAWLGGVRWSDLGAAGWVEEHTPGALATADAMFASTPLPSAFTWF